METIIELDKLTFAYEKENIIEDLSFKINKGDFVGIIGSNGVGKTTLIKLMLGQLKPESGIVKLYGEKINKDGLKMVGYVPQVGMSRGINFPATVEEIVLGNMYQEIGLMRFPKKAHKEKVRSTLKLLGMEAFTKRKFADLSGGQQQRVIIARALVSEPEILFLDEPTTGIDYESERKLYQLLKNFNDEMGITIIMISHDIDKLKGYAKRIIKLDKPGRVEVGDDN